MKQPTPPVPQFELTPQAKAGIFVWDLQQPLSVAGHDLEAPHRDTHYQLVLLTQGRFRLNLDFEEVAGNAPAMLLIMPGQVHQVVEVTEPQGWIITFEPSLVSEELQLLLEQGCRGTIVPQPAFYQQAVALLRLLTDLQTEAADTYTAHATQALLTALLGLLARQVVAPLATPHPRERRGVLLERAFSHLLKQHYKTWKQPAHYASELAVSVAHLNDTIKGLTGSSVTARIQQRTILEAKRLLCFTTLSVKEVGYETGYDEPVYFGKLFKKVTGLTPQQFRHKFREEA